MRVLVCAMRTWGELGNLLAARTLAAAIAEADPDMTAEVIAGDDAVRPLAEIGAAIRELSCESRDAEERRRRYLALMATVEEAYPRGFEAQVEWPPALAAQVDDLGDVLAAHAPDVIVGTKGLLTRLCLAAARRRGIAAPVVNFITNHGLLVLPIHCSTEHPLQLVQYREAAAWLIEKVGAPPSRVRVVGPLVAGKRLGRLLDGDVEREAVAPVQSIGSVGAQLVILSNRGGAAHVRLLEHLAAQHPSVPVLFIALNDSSAMARAAEIARRERVSSWMLVDRLDQGDYLQRLEEAGQSRFGLLVSKAGPNTVAEALMHRLPAVVLPSGLPMEEWVPAWLERCGMGLRASSPESLVEIVDHLVREPSRIAELKRALDARQGDELRFDRTHLEIAGALRELVTARSTRRAAILRIAEEFKAGYEQEVMEPALRQVADDREGLEEELEALPVDTGDLIQAEDAAVMRMYYRRQLRRLDLFVGRLEAERDRLYQEVLRRAEASA